MHRDSPQSLMDGRLPVFVFPTSLTFFSDEQTTHKQVLTLYNPYDFSLRYKVFSTAPKKYTVVESEGTIKSRCCVDVVVRHKDICINNEGVKDKFRLQVTEHGQKTVIGRKDITAVLLPTKERSSIQEEKFEALPISQRPQFSFRGENQQTIASRSGRGSNGSGPGLVVILAAIACILALMLPTQGEKESSLPDYLFLSTNQKLIAAYILGLVTMAILRS